MNGFQPFLGYEWFRKHFADCALFKMPTEITGGGGGGGVKKHRYYADDSINR